MPLRTSSHFVVVPATNEVAWRFWWTAPVSISAGGSSDADLIAWAAASEDVAQAVAAAKAQLSGAANAKWAILSASGQVAAMFDGSGPVSAVDASGQLTEPSWTHEAVGTNSLRSRAFSRGENVNGWPRQQMIEAQKCELKRILGSGMGTYMEISERGVGSEVMYVESTAYTALRSGDFVAA